MRIPPVASQVKCFSLPLLPLGDQPLAERAGGKNKAPLLIAMSYQYQSSACCLHQVPGKDQYYRTGQRSGMVVLLA